MPAEKDRLSQGTLSRKDKEWLTAMMNAQGHNAFADILLGCLIVVLVGIAILLKNIWLLALFLTVVVYALIFEYRKVMDWNCIAKEAE